MGDRRFDNEEMFTERLSLRRPTPADVDVIYSIHRDHQACAHNPGDMLATRAAAEDLYRRWDEHWQRHGFGYWVVRHLHADEPLGFCGIKVMQFQDRRVLNLFYRLDPSAWGDRIGSESAAAVVAWATANLPEHPLIARVRPDNTASLRVAARIGLHRTEHLDADGDDGLDWIFTSNWHDDPTGIADPRS